MNGKNPTRNQKIAINNSGLNCSNWLVIKEYKDNIEIKHRKSGNVKKIKI